MLRKLPVVKCDFYDFVLPKIEILVKDNIFGQTMNFPVILSKQTNFGQ